MKRQLKTILCSMLCAAMLVSSFASCANNSDDDKKTAETGDKNKESNKDKPEFPSADFDGAEFKFLHYGDTATDFHDQYIWSENFSGGAIGDAVIERNQLTEDEYNVVITAEECGPMSEAIKRMQAGQCDFDVIYEWGVRSKSAALDGMLYDAAELEVDMSRSWWVPSANDSLTVSDRMFVFTNMTSMNSLSWAGIVFFNKNLMDKLNIPYPYDYVDSKTWTYDVVIDICMKSEEDINGDGEMGVEDQYGGYSAGSLIGGLCSAPLTEDNGDGTYKLITYTEGMVAAYTQYSKKLSSIKSLGYEDVWEAGVDISQFESKHSGARFYLFGEDHQVLMPGSIDMTKEFVDMQSDYGVVPEPVKKAGDDFSTGVDYCAPMFSMPIQLEDPEMAGMVFDYLAYQSEELLLPAYYDTTIKTKRMQDTRDYDMLDIMRDSITYDWTGIYMWGSELNGMRSSMLTSGNFKSVAKRYEAKCQAELDEVVEQLQSISG